MVIFLCINIIIILFIVIFLCRYNYHRLCCDVKLSNIEELESFYVNLMRNTQVQRERKRERGRGEDKEGIKKRERGGVKI